MGSRFMNRSIFLCERDDSKNSPENSGDSPRSTMLINNDTKMTCTSSPKRRRSIQKRVVSVPIKDVEGSRLKGEMGAPPSDSWAWRKYGQKPIKGSPYPRGYYRCSSSKGCPARKQVERSRADPTMLVVTYACEHNHPWPAASRNNNHHHHQQNHNAAVASASRRKTTIQTPPTNSEEEQEQQDEEEEEEEGDHQKPTNIAPKEEVMINNCDDQKFSNLGEASLSEYGCNWFSDLECTSSTTMLESPILLSEDRVTDDDMAMVFTMPDEDESFFADLGELPECSTVFRRGMMSHHHRRHNLASWCGTTG